MDVQLSKVVNPPQSRQTIWSKDRGARGVISIVIDTQTDLPYVRVQKAFNVGDPEPVPDWYVMTQAR